MIQLSVSPLDDKVNRRSLLVLLLFAAVAVALAVLPGNVPAADEVVAPKSAAAPIAADAPVAADAADAAAVPDTEPEAEDDGAFDRKRGTIALGKDAGNYEDGSHFAKWFWNVDVPRWGMYNVNLIYTSTSPKIGVQAKIGELPALKTYLPRTGGDDKEQSLEMGRVYIEKPGSYPVFLLTGDKSNGPSVFVRGIELVPSPESSPTHQSDQSNIITRPHDGEVGQSIDGDIVLPAGAATTWSEKMRYEPGDEKNCLGFWSEVDDWAEWRFNVHSPGRYKIEVVQGCGEGQGGSKVALNVASEAFEFEVLDTGGFQNWKTVEIGEIDLNSGTHHLAVKPIEKAGKGTLDLHKVTLTPVK